jgi:hypothetical protein
MNLILTDTYKSYVYMYIYISISIIYNHISNPMNLVTYHVNHIYPYIIYNIYISNYIYISISIIYNLYNHISNPMKCKSYILHSFFQAPSIRFVIPAQFHNDLRSSVPQISRYIVVNVRDG